MPSRENVSRDINPNEEVLVLEFQELWKNFTGYYASDQMTSVSNYLVGQALR